MDQFLAIADKHNIGVMFVLFDSVLGPVSPSSGKQRDPKPGTCTTPAGCRAPGRTILKDPARHDELEGLRQGRGRPLPRRPPRAGLGPVQRARQHEQQLSYGQLEPPNKAELVAGAAEEGLRLGPRGRARRSRSPPASGSATGPTRASSRRWRRLQLEQSDVITFHSYGHARRAEALRRATCGGTAGPILCTEYMARPAGSTFDPDPGLLQASRSVGRLQLGLRGRQDADDLSRGTRGRSRTPPSRPSGSTTSSAPTARPTSRQEVEYIRRVTRGGKEGTVIHRVTSGPKAQSFIQRTGNALVIEPRRDNPPSISFPRRPDGPTVPTQRTPSTVDPFQEE